MDAGFSGDRGKDRLNKEGQFGRDLVPYFVNGSNDVNETLTQAQQVQAEKDRKNPQATPAANAKPKRPASAKNARPGNNAAASAEAPSGHSKNPGGRGASPHVPAKRVNEPKSAPAPTGSSHQHQRSTHDRYAGDAFLNTPHPSMLPIPNFGGKESSQPNFLMIDPAIVSIPSAMSPKSPRSADRKGSKKPSSQGGRDRNMSAPLKILQRPSSAAVSNGKPNGKASVEQYQLSRSKSSQSSRSSTASTPKTPTLASSSSFVDAAAPDVVRQRSSGTPPGPSSTQLLASSLQPLPIQLQPASAEFAPQQSSINFLPSQTGHFYTATAAAPIPVTAAPTSGAAQLITPQSLLAATASTTPQHAHPHIQHHHHHHQHQLQLQLQLHQQQQHYNMLQHNQPPPQHHFQHQQQYAFVPHHQNHHHHHHQPLDPGEQLKKLLGLRQ